jgi:hypothetical protein
MWAMDEETLYHQLRLLAETVPELPIYENLPVYPVETHRWLGRLEALVEAASGELEAEIVRDAVSHLAASVYQPRTEAANELRAALFRALAHAEMKIPDGMKGSFIPVGSAFDALRALADILKGADTDILIIDPYMDEVALTDVAILAKEDVNIRLLSDQATVKPTLKPAVAAWITQYSAKRRLAARLASPKTLHDRLIVTDGSAVWILTQSLKDFAKRSPATLISVAHETAALKVQAYEAIWSSATPI